MLRGLRPSRKYLPHMSRLPSLSHVLILTRSLENSVKFYQHGLGLGLKELTDTHAELEMANSDVSVMLRHTEGESMLSHGYFPVLTFNVQDMDAMIPDLIALGGHLDGMIERTPFGQVSSFRAPEGTMISLLEGNSVE